ncbi:BZ3500_MvSof-1268-A1-R1_Chr2-2g05146 [Microbotryum saponariae]|uniref:RNA helicase n=1 Tax=Microbotryum saponariae TaxID=289078 RepID=A0A2X0M0I6_9BASI|nr:BZ3500_MvSof-1268-A1-R1_Chr2-2g05146 [Microbotryum saponariae]
MQSAEPSTSTSTSTSVTPTIAPAVTKTSHQAKPISFASLEPALHPLLLRSLAASQFPVATPIQASLIPLAISTHRDLLARARTGSGKTIAYAIPILHALLTQRAANSSASSVKGTKALILVPTRELAEQVRGQVNKLIQGLGLSDDDEIGLINIAGGVDPKTNKKRKTAKKGVEDKVQLADRPSIVIATPSRALTHLRSQTLHLADLTHLVIDEADLIISYGHSSEDIRSILNGPWGLPKVYQSFLMSATLTGQVEELKGILLRNPIVLKLEDDDDEIANLCTEEDKFLLIYVILKLRLIKGKCLIFVNNTDRGYRLKLYLEKFGIKSGVLNSELPFNSRYHAVQEFNRGVFDYLIATDESGLEGHDRDGAADEDLAPGHIETEGEGAPTFITTQPAGETTTTDASASTKKRKRNTKEASVKASTTEYGVSRGVDFVDVACVINFDLPFSSRSYTHRVGRTARAGRTGTSLSFVVPKESHGLKKQNDVSLPTAIRDETVFARIEKAQKGRGGEVKEYKFDLKQVEGFRYRMEDALRSVTKAAVREARIKEIKNEVVNSDKLKAHFEDNPKDLAFLRHDKPLHPSRVQPHLKHVPSYLMPRIAAVGSSTDPAEALNQVNTGSTKPFDPSQSRVPFHKAQRGGKGGRGGRGGRGGHGGKGSAGQPRRQDPLKGGKFSFGKKKEGK